MSQDVKKSPCTEITGMIVLTYIFTEKCIERFYSHRLFQVPTEFIRKIVILLNKGSIHSSMTLSDDCSGSIGLREDFAKNCFETLLEFSLLDTDASEQDTSITNRLAITSLLQRFKEVRDRSWQTALVICSLLIRESRKCIVKLDLNEHPRYNRVSLYQN